jgi:hypothetical protein
MKVKTLLLAYKKVIMSNSEDNLHSSMPYSTEIWNEYENPVFCGHESMRSSIKLVTLSGTWVEIFFIKEGRTYIPVSESICTYWTSHSTVKTNLIQRMSILN